MFKSFIQIAFRHLLKNKIYSAINIVGLSLGLTSSFLILLFVIDEYSTNSWVKNVDNQYFIESDWEGDVGRLEITTLAPLAKALKDNYPHLVANYFRVHAIGVNVSDGSNKNFRLSAQVGDSTFLNMYGIPLLHGSVNHALDDPNSIVITSETAIKFFGKTDVIGEVLNFKTENITNNPNGNKDYIISGVIELLPQNSITDNLGNRTDIYMNQHNLDYYGVSNMFDNWGIDIIQARIELVDGVNAIDLMEPMNKLIAEHAPDNLKADLIPKLTPLKTYNLTKSNNARKRLLITLSFIAAFILIMAILNFVNITLGTSLRRLKEIGVRKVIGGVRRELVTQFLLESILFSLIACILAVGIVQISLPYFADIVEKPFLFSNLNVNRLFLLFVLVGIFSGLVSGVYPAVVLSGKKTIQSLKGKLQARSNHYLKRSLLGIQLFIAAFFMVSSIVVSAQMDYFLTKDTGYNADNVLVVSSLPRTYSDQGVDRMLDMKRQFLEVPDITSVSLSFEIPDGRRGQDIEIKAVEEEEYQFFPLLTIDSDYLKTYNIPLVEGRIFGDHDIGHNRILINETTSRAIFAEKSAVGQVVNWINGNDLEIIGVIQDYNFGSLHSNIPGCVYGHVQDQDLYRYYSFRFNQQDVASTVEALENKWYEIFPRSPFVYFFMKDKLKELYKAERQFEKALYIGCFFALCIVLMGVFGVTLLNLSERTKEIGIRKSLGASLTHIYSLVAKEYVLLLLLGTVLSFPLAYWTMEKWLSNYAYHIEQSPVVYLLGFITILALVILTISYQIWKAAKTNPVDSLKYE